MKIALGLVLAGGGVLLGYFVYELWPAVDNATRSPPTPRKVALFGGWIEFTPAPESVLVLLVLLSGAIGAYVHVATSFAQFVGVRSFERSWFWWYLLRMPIGAALALILYFALRGGLLAADGTSAAVNPYGVAALAALAGLFSKQATDKLSEVFDTVFSTGEGYGDARRNDALGNLSPTLNELRPGQLAATQDEDLLLVGSGFVEPLAILIRAADASVPPVLRTDKAHVSENELTIRIKAGELQPRDYVVSVLNESPGGGLSETKPLKVT